jgi:hypothetical protein
LKLSQKISFSPAGSVPSSGLLMLLFPFVLHLAFLVGVSFRMVIIISEKKIGVSQNTTILD